ncbi:hypothetical protein PanWU01x14_019410 [Parasponia andersonii]|uniref:Uncharacterized protein n=1 Tax=Parasponia andersonii TaxID=3476 RepID=A0A2P5DYE8_PARAD|nr:hypothetical protein PanWU01x14_019410 [Parasponia andersonii]
MISKDGFVEITCTRPSFKNRFCVKWFSTRSIHVGPKFNKIISCPLRTTGKNTVAFQPKKPEKDAKFLKRIPRACSKNGQDNVSHVATQSRFYPLPKTSQLPNIFSTLEESMYCTRFKVARDNNNKVDQYSSYGEEE